MTTATATETPRKKIWATSDLLGEVKDGRLRQGNEEILWMNKDAFYGGEPEFIVGKGWAIH
jgi:hypothetical protein